MLSEVNTAENTPCTADRGNIYIIIQHSSCWQEENGDTALQRKSQNYVKSYSNLNLCQYLSRKIVMGGERFEMTSCRRPKHPNHWHAVKLMTEEPNPITDIGDDASTLAREVQISLPTRCMEVTQS